VNQNIKPNQNAIRACLIGILVCMLVSTLSGWVTGYNIAPWYDFLEQPSFTPPSWVFTPVWLVLYVMIGISGGLLWNLRERAFFAFSFYVIQLLLNLLWPFIFFGAHQIGFALVNIVLLWIGILLTIVFAYGKNKMAAWLLVPYFLWVTFASVLNYRFWVLN
jgi:benzodiazapine receptor